MTDVQKGSNYLSGALSSLDLVVAGSQYFAPTAQTALETLEITGKFLPPIGFGASVTYGLVSGYNQNGLPGALAGAGNEGFNFGAGWVAGALFFETTAPPLGAAFNVPGVATAGVL